MTRSSEGWQGYSEGFPEGEAGGKSRGAGLPARGKPMISLKTIVLPKTMFEKKILHTGDKASLDRWR